MSELQYRSEMSVLSIQQMGSDEMIARAARRSSKQDGAGKADKLIGSLMRRRHGTPFEHGALTVEVEVPLVVRSEWHRHRIGWSYSELSGRYSEYDPVFYLPGPERGLYNFGSPMSPDIAGTDLGELAGGLRVKTERDWAIYQEAIAKGIAREVARMFLPVTLFTNFWATANPRSIMHFLSLRVNSADATYPTYPMYEIEQAARQLEEIFSAYWPITHAAFVKNGRVAP